MQFKQTIKKQTVLLYQTYNKNLKILLQCKDFKKAFAMQLLEETEKE